MATRSRSRRSISGRPVRCSTGRGNIWFRLSGAYGGTTALRYRYLKVQNYRIAIDFHGDRNDEAGGWNAGNDLYGMYFYRIGGRYSSAGESTAAVTLQNSRWNRVANTHFINIENRTQPGQLHALYIAHYSHSNVIERNRFVSVSGDPVRVRDSSNFNRVSANEFRSTGQKGYYSEWFCGREESDCSKPTRECPSIGNAFRDNHLYGGYDTFLGYRFEIDSFYLHPPDDYCGPLPYPRLPTSGNVKH